MRTAGLIAAAGQSLRMGAFKPLLPIDGQPMIARTADTFLNADVNDLFVVVGKRGDEIISALSGKNTRFLWNRAYETTEMFDSIQIGLTAIQHEGGFDAAFLLPGDMPAVSPQIIKNLIKEMESTDWDVVFPSNGTRRLHPPLVRASSFDALIHYSGNDGLRGAFRETNRRIGYVLTNDEGCQIDVDTPEDYARVTKHILAQNGGTQDR